MSSARQGQGRGLGQPEHRVGNLMRLKASEGGSRRHRASGTQIQLCLAGSGEPKGFYGVGLGDDVNIISYLGFSKITGLRDFPYRWSAVRQ